MATPSQSSPPPSITKRFLDYQEHMLADKEDSHPRVAFVSLDEFAVCWPRVPMDVLYSCVLLVQGDQHWLHDTQGTPLARLDVNFVELLHVKDAQGLIVWMPRNGRTTWHVASTQLSRVRDPVQSQQRGKPWPFAPLLLDVLFWKDQFDPEMALFCPQPTKVVKECLFPSLELAPLMELLHQSNPTMIPMATWDHGVWEIFYEFVVKCFVRKATSIREGRASSKPTAEDWAKKIALENRLSKNLSVRLMPTRAPPDEEDQKSDVPSTDVSILASSPSHSPRLQPEPLTPSAVAALAAMEDDNFHFVGYDDEAQPWDEGNLATLQVDAVPSGLPCWAVPRMV